MLAPGMRRTAQRTMVYNAIVRLGGHCPVMLQQNLRVILLTAAESAADGIEPK